MKSTKQPNWKTLETQKAVVGRDISNEPPSFTKTINVYNHLNTDVVITARDDVPFHCPARGWADNHLYIVVTYSVNRECLVDPYGHFYHSNDEGSMAKAFRHSIDKLNERANDNDRYRNFTITYTYSKEQLTYGGDSIYLIDFDWVVNISGNRTNDVHPYAPTAARLTMMDEEINQRDKGTFNFSAYIVSNDESMDDRFMRIGEMVFRIPSIVNHSQRDGFYICAAVNKKRSKKTTNDVNEIVRDPEYEHLPIEEAEKKYRLYLTRELALSLGDPDAERSREIKMLQRDLEEQKASNQIMQEKIKEQEYERERLRSQREEEVRKRDTERKEHEAREEHYRRERENWRKERQSERQNTQEIIKFIPVLIGSALTVAALILRNS